MCILYIFFHFFFCLSRKQHKKNPLNISFFFLYFSFVVGFSYNFSQTQSSSYKFSNVAHYSLPHTEIRITNREKKKKKEKKSNPSSPQFIHKTDRRLNYSLSPFRWFGISKKKKKKRYFFFFLPPPTSFFRFFFLCCCQSHPIFKLLLCVVALEWNKCAYMQWFFFFLGRKDME